MSADPAVTTPKFADLGLPETLLHALKDIGYETPSPIQAATIPPLLAGRDVLGTAQTGTGKTAAFALPALTQLDAKATKPQVLVLAPTRELAIQVAEAFQKYAHHIPGFQVLPIYGGQSYQPQLAALKRGVHVVVGTPGRVIDHLDRGSLDLSQLRCLVLDEADEMLRMGFIDDVEAVLKKTPPTRQVALFSATMPAQIKRIAQTYLKDPVEIAIKSQTSTAENIRQRYWMVSGINKLDALTRILEAEPFDGMIIFARTKIGTEELAEKLAARGFRAAAINGDVEQKTRERTIQRLKDSQIDVLVATDVAARGLDVERISHVVNYDISYDTESYVHRIGRTGRAGRKGVENPGLPGYRDLLETFERDRNVPMADIAAALAHLLQGKTPLLLDARDIQEAPARKFEPRSDRPQREERPQRGERFERNERPERGERPERAPRERTPRAPGDDAGMITYRIDVGHSHHIKPGNIVGAIANEAELDARHIGRVDIRDDYSLVDLPDGMPPELLAHLKKVRVGGQQLKMRVAEDGDIDAPVRKRPAFKKEGFGKKPSFGAPRKPRYPRE
ncbi:MAG: DEAD/DEAH box helicase [Xanthomonadales bacterium]|nr:DEAD/DEAH box helicase [Xanthomonadales bacterium]